MKVGELRQKLANLDKKEVIKLAVEFYKLVPKSKKVDYNLDALIENPNQSAKKKKTTSLSLDDIEIEIQLFIEHVKAQYYLVPNRVVPKKERATWRFKVKRWYKELSNLKRKDADMHRQATLIKNLYDLLCESCGYTYFTAYDTFQSIGIEQSDFYRTVIILIQEDKGKSGMLDEGISLIINNYLNRYTLNDNLIDELLQELVTADLKYKGIEKIKKMLQKNGFEPQDQGGSRGTFWMQNTDFEKKRRNNDLAEFGMRLYQSLFEVDEGIDFFQKHYYDRSGEVKLYVLVSLLFRNKDKKKIVEQIELAIENDIKPRDQLINLLDQIKTTDELPLYIS